MTPKSFWTILIKIMGVYFLFETIIYIPQFIGQLTVIPHLASLAMDQLAFILGFTTMFTIVFILIMKYCIYNPEWLINKLKLDKGFDQDILTINADRTQILNIAVIVIGGIIIADALPLFCKHMFQYLQSINSYSLFKDFPGAIWIVFFAVKSIIGYLMIAFSRNITLFIERRSDKMGA